MFRNDDVDVDWEVAVESAARISSKHASLKHDDAKTIDIDRLGRDGLCSGVASIAVRGALSRGSMDETMVALQGLSWGQREGVLSTEALATDRWERSTHAHPVPHFLGQSDRIQRPLNDY
jgi:hypothetical protein